MSSILSVPNGEVKKPPAAGAIPPDRGSVVRGMVQYHVTPCCRTASANRLGFLEFLNGSIECNFRLWVEAGRGPQHRQQFSLVGFQSVQQVGRQRDLWGVDFQPIAGQR
jgi:hypothetical protein